MRPSSTGALAGEAPGSAVLVQVNCSAEPQKGGVSPESLPRLAGRAAEASTGCEVQGLMTMSALTDDQAEQRRAFRLLRELRDSGRALGPPAPGAVDGNVR